MWKKILIIVILFYLFALLQSSFFTHFSLFGTIPNLVLIFFFLFVFFSRQNANYYIIFLSAIAGIFLDIFSFTYIGPSIVAFIILGFLLKKIQSLLKIKEDNYPVIYFLPLFTGFLLAYELLMGFYFHITVFMVIYNLLIAVVLFYILKKFFYGDVDTRQLRLFNK